MASKYVPTYYLVIKGKKKSNSSKISSNLMLFTLLLFKNSIEIFYLFVHSSTVSCILKLGENRSLRCENSENLSLITLNIVWLTVVQKTFVFKFVYLFVHSFTFSCIVLPFRA